MNPTKPSDPSTSDLEMFDFGGAVNVQSYKAFLVWAAKNAVSDIHVQGSNPIVIERYGRMVPVTPFSLPDNILSDIIDGLFDPELRAKVRGGTPQDRAIQLDGDQNKRYGLDRGERLRFRCNVVQATAANMLTTCAMTQRVIPTAIPELEAMGIEPDLFEALLPHKGLGLVCGETGSGKSTLLAAIYRYCANLFPDRKITTAEDPVEYIIGRKGDVLPATQLELGRDVATFAEAIRAALRRAPSIIGVGEMRDTETILAAVLSALLGHLCLSTLHTDSVGETIPRLLAGIPIEIREATARDVMGTMQYIIVQRLLRTTDGKRQAVREYLVFDQPLRNEMAQVPYTEWGHLLNRKVREKKGRIADKAFTLLREGIIDRDEMLSVVSPAELREMEACV